MKKVLIALALVVSSLASAKTINYDVFKTEKVVKSLSLRSLSIFDFKLAKETLSKTIISKTCSDNGRYGNRRSRRHDCSEVTVKTIKVAQVIAGYRPTGTIGRDGEVTNGKKMEFVTFNVSLDELSSDSIALLNTRKGLFPKRSKFKRLANELFEISTERMGNKSHMVSISRK